MRQTGRLEASNFKTTGGSVPGGRRRNWAMARFDDACDRGVGIGARLEIDFDQAHPRQAARFDMVDAAAEGEEALETAGDVVFDLLGRHARIEGRDDHHGDLDRRERSTGIRTTLVTPITQIIRQMTMMK